MQEEMVIKYWTFSIKYFNIRAHLGTDSHKAKFQ